MKKYILLVLLSVIAHNPTKAKEFAAVCINLDELKLQVDSAEISFYFEGRDSSYCYSYNIHDEKVDGEVSGTIKLCSEANPKVAVEISYICYREGKVFIKEKSKGKKNEKFNLWPWYEYTIIPIMRKKKITLESTVKVWEYSEDY